MNHDSTQATRPTVLRRTIRHFAAALAATAFAPLAASQGAVWVVDDGGGAGVDFTTPSAAIQAAADGDMILIRAGTYAPKAPGEEVIAVDGKSLTITAEAGDTVIVTDGPGMRSLRIANLADDQEVVVRGITFDLAHSSIWSAAWAPWIANVAGDVRIEDCVIRAGGHMFNKFLLHVVDVASLVLTRCEVRSSALLFPVVLVQGSTLFAYDCVIEAGPSPDAFGSVSPGGRALQAANSRLHLSGGRLVGGDGANGVGFAGACESGGDGGDALQADGCDVVLDGVLLVPGTPGAAFDATCTFGAPGQALALTGGTLTELSGATPRISIDSPIRAGHLARIVFDAPGQLAFALLSTQPTAVELSPFGELLVASPAVLSFPGEVPSYGKTAMLPIGALAPGVEGALYHVQGAFVDAAAGTATLGNATAVTVLAAVL